MKKILLFPLVTIFASVLLWASSCSTPIKSLARAYRERDIDTLNKAVATAKEPWLVADGAEYLGKLKATRSLSILEKRLSDEYLSQEAIANIAVAITKIGSKDHMPIVLSTLERLTDTDERCKLIAALPQHCTADTVAALQNLTQDSDILVNRAAVQALNKCSKKSK